jgi:hypothetical protein
MRDYASVPLRPLLNWRIEPIVMLRNYLEACTCRCVDTEPSNDPLSMLHYFLCISYFILIQ